MKHYWFEVVTDGSDLEGEEFLVCAHSYSEAKEIATDNFMCEQLQYHGTMSDIEAEMSGLDEY